MGEELGTVDDDLARLRDSLAAHQVVNLVGPLGSGKSRLLARLAPDVLVDLTAPGAPGALRAAVARRVRLIGLDGLDSAATLDQAQRILAGRAADTRVVLASRTPLTNWRDPLPTRVDTAPWADREIDALAARHGLGGADERRFVVRMAGGNPLVATCLVAAVHRGAPITRSAAVADHAADVIVARLGTERPGTNWRRLLHALACVGFGDQELLDLSDDEFAVIAGLSIVARAGLGLTIHEPYRTVLDLSYRWRRPLEHRTTLTRASVHRIRMLSETTDHELRKDLTVHGLFLSDEPYVRTMLFPPRPTLPPITEAAKEDADDIARLMRTWALDSDLDTRATDRMADRWLHGSAEHFHLTRDADGRPSALAHLVPFSAAAGSGVEPVAQQFTERFVAEDDDGAFVITGYWPDEATGAALLRRILEEGVDRGRIVVCTPKPEYQRLARGMGLPHYGTTRHDTFGTGHATHVFSQRMAPGDLPGWLSRVSALTGRSSPPDFLTEQLGQALDALRTPHRLARNPLLAAPHTATPNALRAWLVEQIDDLADGDQPANIQAGLILRHYYLGGGEHADIARRLHLSRATYSRLHAKGLTVLTDRFRAAGMSLLAPAAPGPAGATTLDEFTRRLRVLRAWAGNPSYAEITRRVSQLRRSDLSRTTVYDCFRLGRRRLDIDLVTDIVHALGGTDHDTWRHTYGTVTDHPPAPQSA